MIAISSDWGTGEDNSANLSAFIWSYLSISKDWNSDKMKPVSKSKNLISKLFDSSSCEFNN